MANFGELYVRASLDSATVAGLSLHGSLLSGVVGVGELHLLDTSF